jgi:hypothetical protein
MSTISLLWWAFAPFPAAVLMIGPIVALVH